MRRKEGTERALSSPAALIISSHPAAAAAAAPAAPVPPMRVLVEAHRGQGGRDAFCLDHDVAAQLQSVLKDGADGRVFDAAGVDRDDAVLLQDGQGDGGEDDLGSDRGGVRAGGRVRKCCAPSRRGRVENVWAG